MDTKDQKQNPVFTRPAKSDSQEPDENYRQILDLSWDGIVVHDSQNIYFANRCIREIFGLPPDEDLNAASLHRLLAPETRWNLYEALKQAGGVEGRPINFEGRGLRPNGETFPLEVSTSATTYGGRPALQTVLRDITRRKQSEEQQLVEERLSAAGQLALNIAHEINNPLGGIVTYTHLLLEDLAEDAPKEQLVDCAEKVLKLANRCKIIVASLLDFARTDRDGRESVQMNAVIKETLDLLEGHRVMNGMELRLALAQNLPLVLAHRTKMEQVMMNLIINAAEAMEGCGTLSIDSTHDRKRRQVVVRVRDTGPGLTEEARKRLFEPFFSTKPQGRGTGLGLAISHGIVKQHQGSLQVDSQPGRGTTFLVCLPCLSPPPGDSDSAN
jgi:PAS domain S-box-containing protein